MTRRRFFAAYAAGTLVALVAPHARGLTPTVPVLYGDGAHDDTLALRAWGAGLPVNNPDGTPLGRQLTGKHFRLSEAIVVSRQDTVCITECYFDNAHAGFILGV